MINKCWITAFLLGGFLLSTELNAQGFVKRYLNSILNDTSDISRPQFLMYPTLAYSPETSWEIGFSALYVYYAKRDTTHRLSEINGFTFFTLENQYGLWLDHANYAQGDKWFFLGRIRLQSFPLLYYGIGSDSPSDFMARVDANQIWIKERVLKKVRKNLFFGIEMDWQRLSQVRFVPSESVESLELPAGFRGSSNLGLGLGLVYDDRHNVLNVRDGFFSELAVMRYNPFWKSEFNFTSFLSDTRFYHPVGKSNVFAAQVFGQFQTGEVPFNQLSLMGGESLMRGYYTGRYRDRNQLAGQVEMRFLPLPLGFSKRIGAAVFAGASQVFPEVKALKWDNTVWSAGGGLRFLLFPKKDIYTRLDFAFTEEGNGFYLFIGESF
ncbi:BamA/TamA family outer membrane protein [Cyclobacterium jeungdonense]|uniref:BamA/TamA family outer membrane protein n=1 Tax=Cyclobacterium jeungdonense TaxID=708087 RepID=A0ABT8CFQ6_9BACT|nr:BamA/TamA family outer membrane protein [Cyclobacterium jeungdonense]MDN3690603.1 BamA/TamA family outer membrane protein [Cyclobacterium jeungdonense]